MLLEKWRKANRAHSQCSRDYFKINMRVNSETLSRLFLEEKRLALELYSEFKREGDFVLAVPEGALFFKVNQLLGEIVVRIVEVPLCHYDRYLRWKQLCLECDEAYLKYLETSVERRGGLYEPMLELQYARDEAYADISAE